MTKVALSGAGGQIGRVLRPRLLERGVDLRSGGGRTPLEPLSPTEEVTNGDLRDPAAVDRLLQGVDVLIHLAGTSVERPDGQAASRSAPTPRKYRRDRYTAG